MGEVLEALKRNKYLDKGYTDVKSVEVRSFDDILDVIIDEKKKMDRKKRLFADTDKIHKVTTAALYHLSAVCYEIWGKRKEKNHE